LRKDIVLTRKLANMASCATQDNADYSLFIASAAAGKEADADALSKALHAHIETAAHKGITQAQLDRAMQEYQTDSERLDNAHESLASALSVSEVHGDWRLLFEERDIIKSITVDEANAALKKWVVAINRNDVLMHHADNLLAPVIPPPADGKAMVAGKSWPSIIKTADPIPTSAREIANASRVILLDDGQVKAGLISRRTQGDMAWIEVRNHYGSPDSLNGRTHACGIASGLMHFGGGGLSRDALDAKMTSLKARGSVNLGGFSLEAPRSTISDALDTLISVWSAPTLPPGEFENMKAATISSIEAALQEPAALASEQVEQRFNNYPPTHPFRHYTPEEGLQTIRAITYDDVKRCIDDFNGRAHMTLGIVGAFSNDDVQKIWAHISRLPKSRVAFARIPAIEPAHQLDVTPVVTSLPNKPNATVFGKTMIPLIQSAEDYAALRIAIQIMGGNSDSRIWRQLRETGGLAYSAGANMSGGTFEPRGAVVFMASAPSDRSDAALALLQQEVARALKDGFSEEEVTREKRAWAQQRTNSLRAESTYAGMLSSGLFDNYDFKWIADYDDRLSRVTVAEVNRAFRKYLEAAPLIWAIGRGK
jgi:zinc protease